MKSAAIVGAGLVGQAWAIVFARAGWLVRIFEPNEEVRQALPDGLRRMADELTFSGLAVDSGFVISNISIIDRIEEALEGVDFVQESGPELVEVKKSIFADCDRIAPRDAILASSSSAITASRFSEHLASRERCLIRHPVNPPHLVPVVEVCGAPWTLPTVIERARAIYRSVGQIPVVVHQEIEGFVLNRLQSVVIAEALRLVAQGVISPKDLDHTMKDGLGLRWALMGPFETIELNAPDGLADYFERYGPAFQRIAGAPPDHSVWDRANVENLVAQWGRPTREALRTKIERRDKSLAALVLHKKANADPV